MAYRFTEAFLLTRLPKHYLQHKQDLQKPQTPVHYIPEEGGSWKRCPNGEITRIENVPLVLLRTPKEDEGLWGGEAIVKGYKKRKFIQRIPHYWVPSLGFSVVHSEILDKYMKVVLTNRTLRLIDQYYGFDSYILRSPVQDLRSQLGLDIRRKLLLSLIRRDFCHNDADKQERIYNKFKDCLIPEEEAEWFGLSLLEALRKQRKIEVQLSKPVPQKIEYRKDLFHQLKEWKIRTDSRAEEETSSSWFSKGKFFGKKEQS